MGEVAATASLNVFQRGPDPSFDAKQIEERGYGPTGLFWRILSVGKRAWFIGVFGLMCLVGIPAMFEGAAVAWLVAAPFLGGLALRYWRRAGRVGRLVVSEIGVIADRAGLQALRDERAAIRTTLTALSADFEKISPPGGPVRRTGRLQLILR